MAERNLKGRLPKQLALLTKLKKLCVCKALHVMLYVIFPEMEQAHLFAMIRGRK